eukprot:g1002.t1
MLTNLFTAKNSRQSMYLQVVAAATTVVVAAGMIVVAVDMIVVAVDMIVVEEAMTGVDTVAAVGGVDMEEAAVGTAVATTTDQLTEAAPWMCAATTTVAQDTPELRDKFMALIVDEMQKMEGKMSDRNLGKPRNGDGCFALFICYVPEAIYRDKNILSETVSRWASGAGGKCVVHVIDL